MNLMWNAEVVCFPGIHFSRHVNFLDNIVLITKQQQANIKTESGPVQELQSKNCRHVLHQIIPGSGRLCKIPDVSFLPGQYSISVLAVNQTLHLTYQQLTYTLSVGTR